MTEKVRAAVLDEPFKMSIQEFDMPKIGLDDAILKVELAGVCGSDPHRYDGSLGNMLACPTIPGHEVVGRIHKIGEVASQRWGVKEGDRVIVEAIIRCGFCSNCVSGDYRYCTSATTYGGQISKNEKPHLWGSYADYMYLAPGSLMHKISDDVPGEAAVMVNAILADAMRWGRFLGEYCIGDAVVIQGAGPQGACQAIIAKESGCYPIIVTGLGKDKMRLEMAKDFGADYVIDVEAEDVVARVSEITKGAMADVVVDVTGSPNSIPTSCDLVKAQGILVLPTITAGKSAEIVTDQLVIKDVTVRCAFTTDNRAVERSIKLAETLRYPMEDMVTHTFPLEEAEKAIKLVAGQFPDDPCMKVVLKP